MATLTVAKAKSIRDSWEQEHECAIEETNRALAHERRALKRFQQADDAYNKAVARAAKQGR